MPIIDKYCIVERDVFVNIYLNEYLYIYVCAKYSETCL